MKPNEIATEIAPVRIRRGWHLRLLLVLSLGCACHLVPAAHAQRMTQDFVLQPGWNSIWLEVDPTNRQPAEVFKNLPAASVWTWSERVTATDFIQNPATVGWNRNQWLGWFPPGSPEAVLANLYSVQPSRAYLIRLAGKSSVTFRVTGTPHPLPTSWAANQYNLRGLPADAAAPATFGQFFRHSPAHWRADTRGPTDIYRLQPDGHWIAVTPDEPIRRGEAYWIYTQGASKYPAPFGVQPSTGSSVHFPDRAYHATVTLANWTGVSRTLTIAALGESSRAVQVENPPSPGAALAHVPLAGYSVTLAPGRQQTLRLFLDRTLHPAGHQEHLVSITDHEGVVQHLGITSDGAGLVGADASQDYPLAGLWVGTALVQAVGEAHGNDVAAPTAAASPFPIRLLLHVDNAGAARLLRSVTFATLPATYTNAPSSTNSTVVLGSATNVLLTDPTLLNRYQSRYGRTASMVRRFTAVQFDDAANPAGTPMTGSFVTNGVLTAELNLPSGYATNPYYHRYHPDHDNLSADYTRPAAEDFAIDRRVVLDFTPIGSGVPGFGLDGMDGTYRETISGLHKLPLLVSGTFTLQRLSPIGLLNPSLP